MSPTALSTHDSGCWLNGPPHEGVRTLPMLSNRVMLFAVKFVERRLPLSPKHIPVCSAELLPVLRVSSRTPVALKCLINPLASPARTSPTAYWTPAAEALGAPNTAANPRVSVKTKRTSLGRLICLPLPVASVDIGGRIVMDGRTHNRQQSAETPRIAAGGSSAVAPALPRDRLSSEPCGGPDRPQASSVIG